LLFTAPVARAAAGGSHGDPVAPILIALVLISIGAALGGRGMRKLGQPAVLGELLVGVLVANAAYAWGEPVMTVLREGETMMHIVEKSFMENVSAAEAARQLLPDSAGSRRIVEVLASPAGPVAISVYEFVDLVSRIAVIVLLFLVGLETSYHEMRKVGGPALLVAIVGVVLPFALGVGVMRVLMPEAPLAKDIFIGAILTATSVGITARVFRDLGQTRSDEARIILGAAVIDDVLGLIVLAVVSGLVATGTISVVSVTAITLKSAAFLFGSIALGMWLAPRLVRRVARLELENQKLLFGLGFAFLLAWLGSLMGLATIVGAFAAGLILEEFFLEEFKGQSLRELLSPIESLIVPVFFVLMGMQVKLETFADTQVLGVAAALTVCAIIGKVLAGFVCPPRLNRLAIGFGMMPRGEVGLIFASIGKGLGVVNDAVFSAAVIMVMVTTLLTPPLLKVTLGSRASKTA
jgi:Kef-type K+ transport system membrane component KefB